MGAPATSPGNYVDVDGEAERDLADLNAAKEPLGHTILKTKLTELQEACRRVEDAVSSSMIDVVDFAFWRVLAVAVNNTFSNDVLWRTAEVCKLQIDCDRLTAQMSSSTPEWDTWRSSARE